MFRAQGSYPQSSQSLTLPEQPPLLSVYTIQVHKHSAAPKSQKFIHFISSPIDTFSLSAFHLPRTVQQHKILAKWEKENMQREGFARNCHYILCYTHTAYNTYIAISMLCIYLLWIGFGIGCLWTVHKNAPRLMS